MVNLSIYTASSSLLSIMRRVPEVEKSHDISWHSRDMPVKPPQPVGDSQTTYIPTDLSHINILSLARLKPVGHTEEVCGSVLKYSASTELFRCIEVQTADHWVSHTHIYVKPNKYLQLSICKKVALAEQMTDYFSDIIIRHLSYTAPQLAD